MCALRWPDINLEDGKVVIERGIIVVAGGLQERPTKTHNRRVVVLDHGTVRLLRGHRQREESTARACGLELEPTAFVFSRRPGGTLPLRPDNATATFAALARAAGIEGLSLKDATRHLAATRLIAAGVDVRTVAGRLGHRRASTTLDVYAHWLPERDREAAEIIGAELDDSDPPTSSPLEATQPRRGYPAPAGVADGGKLPTVDHRPDGLAVDPQDDGGLVDRERRVRRREQVGAGAPTAGGHEVGWSHGTFIEGVIATVIGAVIASKRSSGAHRRCHPRCHRARRGMVTPTARGRCRARVGGTGGARAWIRACRWPSSWPGMRGAWR